MRLVTWGGLETCDFLVVHHGAVGRSDILEAVFGILACGVDGGGGRGFTGGGDDDTIGDGRGGWTGEEGFIGGGDWIGGWDKAGTGGGDGGEG